MTLGVFGVDYAMELAALILSVASTATVVIGGLLLWGYLPAYLSEKGKNLASKEDISRITELVEGVKAQYTTRLERQKAALLAEGEVVERRRRVYEDICASLRVFIAGHTSSAEAKDRFHAAYATAWLWGSDSVLRPLNGFLDLQVQHAARPGSVDQSLMKRTYTEILMAMRKDVGFPATDASPEDYRFVQF